MRIISGEFRSRKLLSPPENSETRPIPDRVKESLFNLLRGHFEGVHVLDAFAGTGSVGLEAISRGAAFCTFIERDRAVAKVLEANIRTLGCTDRCQVVVGDALGAAALARLHEQVHVAFFDPPYAVVTNDLGWRRTRDQFTRVLSHLDEGGFLVHRTPWPFVESTEPEGAHEPEGHGADERRVRHTRVDDEDQFDARHPAHPEYRPRNVRRTRKSDVESNDPEPAQRSPEAQPPGMPPLELSIDLSDPNADAALDAFEAELARASGAAPARDIDLAIPGGIGPETHPYGTTAIHLYQSAPR